MERSQYQVMRAVEDTHFWYVGMRRITETLLRRNTRRRSLRILDAGCGTGAGLLFLQKYGKVQGIDLSQDALTLARQRGLRQLQHGSINQLPFPDSTFDLVTNFDVLGSRGVNERQAVAEFFRVLKPGGHLLIRVSAYAWLYSHHDRVVHTQRRYSKQSLSHILTAQGFILQRLTYANMFLFPLIALHRIWQKRFVKKNLTVETKSDVVPLPAWINRLGIFPLMLESRLVQWFNLPFGLSLIALAKKHL